MRGVNVRVWGVLRALPRHAKVLRLARGGGYTAALAEAGQPQDDIGWEMGVGGRAIAG